ncbi:DUF1835 domain-containing protein [Sphingobacterium sp. DN00404]|uniref:DUF1835 domain-containing protein n=1 Tax=Sphingobacterium micropteri TaxID=2763501 RepID=A0ABR7YQQ1_9SPHI|nr:DUF1835 domain-containing protein [Sphingobacterium micropteri]MBD1433668.1 DUF1835 domain-containing protein [Sphingobacterium micropteri]
MLRKDLHITFGFSGNAVLKESQLINTKQGEILGFTDPLSQGPLCDLEDTETIKRRKLWMKDVFGSIQLEGGSTFIDDDLNLLTRLMNNAVDFNAIYLWLGDEADEKITAARLLYHLQGQLIPIYKLNFDKMEFRNEKGTKLEINTLQVMCVDNIPEASKYFVELSAADKQAFVSLWDNIREDVSAVHIFDKSGKYVSGNETFFDELLLSKCNNTTQRSSLIVANTLFTIWEKFGGGVVGDLFLYHRLKMLSKMGKIEISNPHEDAERAKMIFDVKKLN